MDIEAIRLSIAVARLGSFAAAARQFDVDPSAVTRAVAALERELDVRLFNRTTRRVSPTQAGSAWLARVEGALDEIVRAGDDARQSRGTIGGRVRLGATIAFGTHCLLPLMADYRRALPAIELELALADVVDDLVDANLDLALRHGPQIHQDVIATRLMTTRYRVVASPQLFDGRAAPPTPDALGDLDCLLQDLPQYRSRWLFRDAAGANLSVAVQGRLVISSPLALREAAIAGLGPALLADWLVADDLASGRLVDLFPQYQATATDFDTAVWLVYSSRAYLPARTRATIDFLRANLGAVSANSGQAME